MAEVTNSGDVSRRESGSARVRLLGTVTALAFFGSLLGPVTTPAAHADDLARQIERITNQVDDLQAQAESAAEAYREARAEQQRLDRRLASINKKVRRSERSMGALQASIDAIAVRAYTSGTVSPSLELLLSNSPSSLLDRSEVLAMIGARQGSQLQRVTSTRLTLERNRGEIAALRAEQSKVVARMNKHRRAMQAKFSAANRILNSLKGRARVIYEQQQRERRKRQLAEARAAAAAWAKKKGKGGKKVVVPKGVSPIAARALQFALSQVGKPYIAFTDGDTSYDCSGLTTAAYRKAGVSLPHYSKAQMRVTRPVSRSQAKPGDLVFFFRGGVHHVAMYIGNGKIVHALNPRVDVTITRLSDRWEARHLSGFGRVG